MALRTMCMSGSDSSSTMLRSSSVSSPLASFEIHSLTVLARQVAHQTRHFLKQYSYRNHAHGHGRFLDPFCNAFELRKIAQQPWSADLLYFRIVPDHGLGDDHLAHHIQQVVERSEERRVGKECRCRV